MSTTFKGEIKVTEKYTKDGEEKKYYHKIGALFERDDGSLCVQLVGGGWANVYPPKMGNGGYEAAKQSKQPMQGGGVPDGALDDEIPFNVML